VRKWLQTADSGESTLARANARKEIPTSQQRLKEILERER
jgi:hypothetical protein